MQFIKKVFFVGFLFSSIFSFSQEIVTDRPDQTESSITVEHKSLQIEGGISLSKNNEGNEKSFAAPSVLFRYGIIKGLELRLFTQYESINREDSGTTLNYNGFNDLEIGAKIQLLKNDKKNIEMAFLSHLIIPTAKKELTSNAFGVINKLAISHKISNKIGLGYNIGYDFIENINALTYSVALGIALSDSVGFYIEHYGTWAEQNQFESNFDGGFTYLLNSNLQLDISYGFGINNSMNYISTGLSWNIPSFLSKK